MTVMLIDRIGTVTFQNGLLRVDCVAAGPNNEERASGTLLIPINQANAVLQSLIAAAQELDRRLREQVQQQAGTAAATPPVAPQPQEAPPEARGGKKKQAAN